jgi:hypothetical protein
MNEAYITWSDPDAKTAEENKMTASRPMMGGEGNEYLWGTSDKDGENTIPAESKIE